MLSRLQSASHGIHWTFHARDKMRFYRLSEQRVKRVIHSPKRVEEGVVPKTVAMMQPTNATRDMKQGTGKEKWTQEIWVMLEKQNATRLRQGYGGQASDKAQGMKIISAWRYPGMSKPRSEMIKKFIRQEYEESFSGK